MELIRQGLDMEGFYFQSQTDVASMRACIEILNNSSFAREKRNFTSRIEAIDFIDLYIIHPLELLLETRRRRELIALKHRASQVKDAMEEINIALFRDLREDIRNKRCRGEDFMQLVGNYVELDSIGQGPGEVIRYDHLDSFVDGLVSFHIVPEVTGELEPGMIAYQKTPARVIFELAQRCQFTTDDVFFDLGAGLGQVPILVNLLCGVTAKGVEVEPAFCRYANACAKTLDLTGVAFINADARNACYRDGTVFFMFTPFTGKILETVLEMLRNESRLRPIRIIAYGPCAARLALEPWLRVMDAIENSTYRPVVFSSC